MCPWVPVATTSFDDSPEGLGLVIVLAAMIGDSGRRGGKISQGKARGRSPGKPGAGFRGASGRAVPQDLPDSPRQQDGMLPVRGVCWRRGAQGFDCGLIAGQPLCPNLPDSREESGAQCRPCCCPLLGTGIDRFLRVNVGGKLLETQVPRCQPRTVLVTSRTVAPPGMWTLFCT